MLHLSAICILMYRIRKSRNCIGKCLISPLFFARTFVQDPGDLSDSVLHEIHGPLHVLHFGLQHFDETFLHFFDCFHCLPDEIQETILHSKLPFVLISYRLMIQWAMISLTLKSCSQRPLFLPASSNPDGPRGSLPGVSVSGWRLSHFCLKLLCLIR